MKELPGDVFVTGQIDLMSLTALVEQGTMSFINNRPNNEAFMQPDSESLSHVVFCPCQITWGRWCFRGDLNIRL